MIDIDKKYQTRDGRAVRLISNNGSPEFPIIGVVEGHTQPLCWAAAGYYYSEQNQGSLDLVPVPPPKRVVYMNVYECGTMAQHPTREKADQKALSSRVACVRVEYTGGQFDE